ncbi:MAG TPA: carboxypeptidase regulatory-like domain-containing protein [Candidatus Sulfotelmatobacter sp.]|nr:carboxypeptidase regulatory-like domain-containing protein [Candidatus Sulfotelmatobacter sp.]
MGNSRRWFTVFVLCTLLMGMVAAPVLVAQTTISTGSIVGTVTDPSGAVISAAKVTITNKATGQVITTATTSSGTYTSGALTPGSYQIRIEGAGFKTAELGVTVQVNTTASGNIRLEVGQSAQVVEVQATEMGVNTEQATVQGVLTSEQIENLPINGRNFLDLAQLEPGVQIQDGGTFDPTKNGFSSVSFSGRFGRTARIEVDGVDISDETVGTTTQNLPLGAIQESSLQQSSLDLSTELTSSGSVNVTTKSGTNSLHGEGFYYFRDQSLNANLPGASTNPFQRNQFGGSLGGPIRKDKLFFFFDAERTKQDLLDPVIPGGPFGGLTGSFNSPFRETETIGRVDWLPGRYKVFYRFTYDQNKSVLPFIPNSFQPFANVDHARSHIGGVDFSTGSFAHSVRFGYTKFENGITDAVAGSSIFNPAPGIELAIGGDPNCLTAGLDVFCSGPNFLAPQATMQSNKQIKYDGTKAYKNHIIRFGAGYNHIQGGGYAKFLGLAPAVGAPNATPPCVASGNCPFPDGAGNPLNYPVTNVNLGNGQGYSSEKAAFGLPGGGLGPDNRLSLYVGDAWKIKPAFVLNLGLRYVRDTGRTDSDLGPIAALDQFNYSNNYFTYRGLGNRVRQPNSNFAPQVGFAWDPSGRGTTVIRGGIGLFYENSIWNNNLFDRPARLEQGLFLGSTPVCSSGAPQALPFSSNIDPGAICGQPIGSVASDLVTLQQQYQAATLAAGPAQNGAYIANTLADGIDVTGTNLFYPAYVTPRSVQMNIGMQKQIRRGSVLTVDVLRNVSTHNMLSIDTNHVGDFRTLVVSNAQAAITAVEINCGRGLNVPSTYSGNCFNDPVNGTTDQGTWVPRPATISDYASAGLDSGYALCAGFPCQKAAFPGFNQNLGTNQMLFPIGRSVYNGLQTTLKQDLNNPFHGIKNVNMQVSYAFSRYVASARDSDFINFPVDNSNPLKYLGPNGLDRTHQISFGGVVDLPVHFRMSLIGHFDSPLPLDVRLPTSGNPGGIFQTDITGDGTGDGTFGSNGGIGDLLPGTKQGAFGRDFGTDGLNKKISTFNTAMVGQLTPAGQALVTNNLMTQADLTALGGVINGGTPIQTAPAGAIGQGWLKTFDLGITWAYKVKERVELRPGVTIFNVFNFSNFTGPAIPFSSILDGSVGSANGTTSALQHGADGNFLRLGLGSGVNALGAPRAIEFALKLSF